MLPHRAPGTSTVRGRRPRAHGHWWAAAQAWRSAPRRRASTHWRRAAAAHWGAPGPEPVCRPVGHKKGVRTPLALSGRTGRPRGPRGGPVRARPWREVWGAPSDTRVAPLPPSKRREGRALRGGTAHVCGLTGERGLLLLRQGGLSGTGSPVTSGGFAGARTRRPDAVDDRAPGGPCAPLLPVCGARLAPPCWTTTRCAQQRRRSRPRGSGGVPRPRSFRHTHATLQDLVASFTPAPWRFGRAASDAAPSTTLCRWANQTR